MQSHINTLRRVTVGLLLVPALCLAHGVAYRLFDTGRGIQATYDDGRPMAFCDVSVFAPSDPTEAYQTGSTDPHGRFAFVPDTNGLWRVTVDDGMGHAVSAEVPVDATRLDSPPSPRKLSRPLGALVGISIIFGLFGIYALARQATGRGDGKPGCGAEDCACTSPKA